MSRQHTWMDSHPEREQLIHQASELNLVHIGRLITVAGQDASRCRGHLAGIHPAGPDDLTARPGDLVLEMRPRRSAPTGPARWRAVVAPDARVIVHSPTHD